MKASEATIISKESESYFKEKMKNAYALITAQAEMGNFDAWIDRPESEKLWDKMAKELSDNGFKVENQSGNKHYITWSR